MFTYSNNNILDGLWWWWLYKPDEAAEDDDEDDEDEERARRHADDDGQLLLGQHGVGPGGGEGESDVLYCTVLYCTVLYLGSVKVRVTLRSAMPPLLMATQLYWPRSLEVTAVTVRLKFRSMPPSGREFVNTCHSSCLRCVAIVMVNTCFVPSIYYLLLLRG